MVTDSLARTAPLLSVTVPTIEPASVWPNATREESNASKGQPMRRRCFVIDFPRRWKIETAGRLNERAFGSRETICVFFMRPSPLKSISEIFFNPKHQPIDCRTPNHCYLATRRAGRENLNDPLSVPKASLLRRV